MSVDLDSWLVPYLDSVTGSLSSFFTHARVSLAPNGASTRVRMDLSGPSQPFLHGGTLLQPSFDWPEVHGRAHGWLRLALEQAGLSWPGTMVDLHRAGLETASVTLLDERGAPLRELQVDHDWVVDQAVTPQLMASISSMLDEALHRQHVLNQRLRGLQRWALGPGVVALTIDGARVQLPAHVLGRYTANDCTLGWSWQGEDPAMGAQAQRVRDAFRTVPGAGAFRRAHVVGSRDLAQWVALSAAATLGAHALFMPPTAPGETLFIALMALPGEKTEPLPATTWAAQGEGPRADTTSARPQRGGTVGPLAPWAGSWLDAQALRDLQARLAGSWNPPLSAAALQAALSWMKGAAPVLAWFSHGDGQPGEGGALSLQQAITWRRTLLMNDKSEDSHLKGNQGWLPLIRLPQGFLLFDSAAGGLVLRPGQAPELYSRFRQTPLPLASVLGSLR